MLTMADKRVGQSTVERGRVPAIQFGRLRLYSRRRELLVDQVTVPIGGSGLDILIALTEARGGLVTKDELVSRVWREAVVEENTLQFQISTIRTVPGEDRDFIKTISGRGYRFVSEITDVTGQDDTAFAHVAAPARPFLAPPGLTPTSDFIGRETRFQDAADLMEAHRLVTLTGVGRIGKTRLGLELARPLVPKFANGVWLVDLGLMSDPELVPHAIATVPGIAGNVVSPKQLAAVLASKDMLLVLDNCEHVIDPAACIAETSLHGSATVRMIATNREPLRVDGECVFPVPALDLPATDVEHFEEVTRHGAVQLFIARARAADPRLSLDERFGAAMAMICRRVDSFPLAIEFAASRAAALGIEELANGLDQCFDLLTGGRRTALPRHQTPRATLDWSHELLTETQQTVLRRLAIFAGGFRLEAATEIAGGADIARREVVDCLANLVMKSQVTADVDGAIARYRLPETTRAYMLEKLTVSGERDEIARRHAEYYRNLFKRAAAGSEARSVGEWSEIYGPDLDNVRAAVDWAFSPSGDESIGEALARGSVPRWLHLPRMEESQTPSDTAVSSNTAYVKLHPLAAHAVSPKPPRGDAPGIGVAWAKMVEFTDAFAESAR